MSDVSVYRSALRWVLWMSAIGCLLSLQYHWTELATGTAKARLSGNGILYPISYGHMGVTTAVLSLFYMVRQVAVGSLSSVALSGCVVLGITTVLLSASRGPLIALVVLCPVAVICASAGRLTKLAGWFVALGLGTAVAMPIIVQQVMLRGIALRTYFGSVGAFTEGQSTKERFILMHNGWQMFLDHPFVGGGLFQPWLITYPHNTIVEAFMATGIVGGTAYCIMLGIALAKALRLMKCRPEMSWLGVLFLQYLINSLLSGNLYFDPPFFALMGVMLAAQLSPPSRPWLRRPRRYSVREFRSARAMVHNRSVGGLSASELITGTTSGLN